MASTHAPTDRTNDNPLPFLKKGVYVPTVAFFKDNSTQDLDLDTTRKHAVHLAQSGITGLVVHGSNGEAVHLSLSERDAITHATRQALDSSGYSHLPVIVGCSAQSTSQTIELCKRAHEAGGSHVLILPPSYYRSITGRDQILAYYREVADESPLGVLIYNFPAAASGLDLDSDDIIALSQHPNIKGVKLTCGNTGKLARIAASAPSDFIVLGGSADFILQTLVVGGHGTIAGLANLSPKACLRVVELFEKGELEEARRVQGVLARGDWAAIRGGFPAVKRALRTFRGYGGVPRRPVGEVKGEEWKVMEEEFGELFELEKSL